MEVRSGRRSRRSCNGINPQHTRVNLTARRGRAFSRRRFYTPPSFDPLTFPAGATSARTASAGERTRTDGRAKGDVCGCALRYKGFVCGHTAAVVIRCMHTCAQTLISCSSSIRRRSEFSPERAGRGAEKGRQEKDARLAQRRVQGNAWVAVLLGTPHPRAVPGYTVASPVVVVVVSLPLCLRCWLVLIGPTPFFLPHPQHSRSPWHQRSTGRGRAGDRGGRAQCPPPPPPSTFKSRDFSKRGSEGRLSPPLSTFGLCSGQFEREGHWQH